MSNGWLFSGFNAVRCPVDFKILIASLPIKIMYLKILYIFSLSFFDVLWYGIFKKSQISL